MQESSRVLSSYSTNSELAARELASVEDEFNFYFDPPSEEGGGSERDKEKSVEDAEAEFEFAFVTKDSVFPSPISADEIFHNGQIRPVFNRGLFEVRRQNVEEKSDSITVPTVRLPLRKLFNKERESTMTTMSSSSSDADELDGIPEESYCVWRPKEADGRCKKSSSKRWSFRDLLNRSLSKGSFVVFSPSNSGRNKQNENRGKVAPVSSGNVKHAAANQDGRRSYLPYRRDLVGFFSNVNGAS